MYDLKEVSGKVRAALSEQGVVQFSYKIYESEKKELNTEGGEFSLFRTTFDNGLTVNTLIDGRKGTASGHDLTAAGIETAVADAVSGAESAMPDAANAIAEKQSAEVFRHGPYEADMEKFYERLTELLETVGRDYPLIRIMMLVADHTKTHTIYENSNGTEFESFDGVYGVTLEFAGNDGERTTGINFTGFYTRDLSRPLIELAGMRKMLEDTEKSLELTAIEGKFEGTVIFTPGCLANFVYMLAENYLSGNVIMEGTSRWKDSIGEQVASDKVSISLRVSDPRLASVQHFTDDGYKAEDVTVLEQGVLRSHLLSLYASLKTGRPVTKNDGSGIVMESGDVSLADMIAGVERGLIVGGFSGGEPGANGEFSGVAKNSFYIENGRIAGAVSETMINGNLEAVFKTVRAISREVICDGDSVFPYMASDGIVISGK